MLTGEHVRHGQDNPTDAERYTCRDFEQPCAYGATGRRLQAGLAKGQSLQSGQQDIGCGREPHSRSWLARMVWDEVLSENRSIWHSLMRFSISPRAQ
ncbi:hypothetical protein S1001342_02743 (plasmid) [Acetobacter pasteurianus subsp. pasteurianus]|uniref:Uncharacterized protein n=1 Tax=Acetobacter pasteurianus subsp. pasteurianus TaxID=481145 RepID=A0A1Y0Y1R8_ACEPA|nr:hypothetical protein S1001342_02049 [Acetobacter pasteurianus subsp. pasteurianus]ARW49033.1 hypothetical protein S1001342_02743 [Acetobacter pasteurianus subsp. pasteurianus]